MDEMPKTILKAQASSAPAGTSKVPPTQTSIPPPSPTINPSQEEEPAIELSSAPTFGFDDEDIQEVNKTNPSDDDMMMFEEEEESSGSHHSKSKPKKKKKKKNVVTKKEFLSLQAKVDQIMAAVKPTQPQPEDTPRPQSLIERIERLETREHMVVERISLKVEMGIRSVDNNRKADHKEFLAVAERLIIEATAIKTDLQATIADQASQS
ncbi:uncharacterized protein LOC111902691 [Lactuca sativa]|uniref:uncharacterized protein LOC111902691 n=1 Tax=Lactuca sativa TaxID=4236 RepID=UPI000CD980F2|nr:uncharacterized protein LOC111902691 [Lactuca sativa]